MLPSSQMKVWYYQAKTKKKNNETSAGPLEPTRSDRTIWIARHYLYATAADCKAECPS